MTETRVSTCEHCGAELKPFTLDLPLGLGARNFLMECPCVTTRRETAVRERQTQEHQRRVRTLLAQAGIGVRHRDATFETFETATATCSAVEACRAFVDRFPDGGRGLTLCGPPGTGKTHLAVAITRALVERGIAAVIVNVPLLFVTFRSALHGERPWQFDQLLDLILTCDHLALDDLGRERLTEWVEETLYLVLNARYEHRLSTSITTNLPLDDLRRRLGDPIIDRLAETNTPFRCEWPSWRRRAAP